MQRLTQLPLLTLLLHLLFQLLQQQQVGVLLPHPPLLLLNWAAARLVLLLLQLLLLQMQPVQVALQHNGQQPLQASFCLPCSPLPSSLCLSEEV